MIFVVVCCPHKNRHISRSRHLKLVSDQYRQTITKLMGKKSGKSLFPNV